MYRQVGQDTKDRNLHQLYGRSSEDQPVEKLRLSRNIYGVLSSSYHAFRALRDCKIGRNSCSKGFYIGIFLLDDFVGSANSPAEAKQLYNITQALNSAGMSVRK